MEAPLQNPDRRPLPAGCITHFDPQRKLWYYVHLQSIPPRVTFIHPGDEDPPTPPSSAASPVLQVPAGLPTTPRRPATAPSTPSNSHSPLSFQPLQIRQSSQPSKAQQLYASAGNVTSPPSTGSEGAQRSLYRADQSSAEFDPVSLYGSPVSLSPTSPPSGSNLSPAPLSPNRPQFFQESFSRPQRRVGHSASFSAGYPFSSTATHTRDDSTTSDFRTRTLFQAAPTVESLQARKPPIDPAIRRNRTESALITMPYYNSSADTFQKPGGLPVYGSTNQPSAPTDTTMLLSPASSSPPLTSPGVPMTSSTTPLNSQDFYVHGVSAPGPVFVVPQGTSMPQLPGLASAPVTGQPPQTSLSSTGAPSRYKTLPNLPSYSHSGSISPQQMAAQPAQQPQNHRLSLPPGAAAPQMVPSLLPLTMGTAQAPVMPTQQYNYLPNGQSLSPPAVGSTPFQGVATMQMQGVPQQQFAPNPQQQQQDEARKKQTKILKKVGITLGKTALKVGAKAALGGMGVDQGIANVAVNVAAFGIEKAVNVASDVNKQQEQQRAMQLAAQQQQQQQQQMQLAVQQQQQMQQMQMQAAGWQLPPGASVPQMVGTGPFVGQFQPQR